MLANIDKINYAAWYVAFWFLVMSYLGSKGGSGVHQAIINVMPPHELFGELFGGTGVITKKKAPAMRSIFMDKSQRMVDAFNYDADKSCGCAIEFLESFEPKLKTLFYLDPPYMPETRTSSAKYEHELTAVEHERLLNAAIKQAEKGVFIIVSGYDNDLYKRVLKGWWRKDFQSMTRGGVRTETIWCSFVPSDIHYHKYAGENYTDRQRIKRKAEGWARKYSKLPHAERQAIMAAMLSVE